MNPSFTDRRVILVGGSGGVGKTTVAAALGVQLAIQGHRTIVLTVDPARRLAQALGLTSFSGEIQSIQIPEAPHAKLFVTMLDTQRDFDRVIRRFARTKEQEERIFNNRMYRTMVERLGGTHEYAAMERLLEFAKNPEYDRIVIDTPPSQNAVDLLSAPERLAEFMDSSVIKWLQGDPSRFLSVFKQGAKLAVKTLVTIFGSDVFDELSATLRELDGMQAGFRSRNIEVMETLRSEKTAFLLVTYPSEIRYEEAVDFLASLKEKEIPVRGLILNRLELYSPECVSHSENISDELRSLADPILEFSHALYKEQHLWVERFRTLLKGQLIVEIPKQIEPLHSVSALAKLKLLEPQTSTV